MGRRAGDLLRDGRPCRYRGKRCGAVAAVVRADRLRHRVHGRSDAVRARGVSCGPDRATARARIRIRVVIDGEAGSIVMPEAKTWDVVVVGGGPSGATAATDLARMGHDVLLLDRAGRIKPCGGAIPPRLIAEFEIPDELLVARISSARMVSPTNRQVDMPIDGGFVGMVDREVFDEWLRHRAAAAGAERRTGTFRKLTRDPDGVAVLHCGFRGVEGEVQEAQIRARAVIGADGAVSAVARECIPEAAGMRYVFAYHEIVRSPESAHASFDGTRCDVVYRGELSPDFYSWVFPHGATTSIGTGSAHKGFS